MEISDQIIQGFTGIYEKKYGVTLDNKTAHKKAKNLLLLMKIIMKYEKRMDKTL